MTTGQSLDFYVETDVSKEQEVASIPCAWVTRPVCGNCHKMLSLKTAQNSGSVYCMGRTNGKICGTVNVI